MEKKKCFFKRLVTLLCILYHFVHVMLFLSLEFFSVIPYICGLTR